MPGESVISARPVFEGRCLRAGKRYHCGESSRAWIGACRRAFRVGVAAKCEAVRTRPRGFPISGNQAILHSQPVEGFCLPLPFRARPVASTRPLVLITKAALPAWLKAAPSATRNWVSGCGFAGKPGEICVIPGRDGKPARALAGMAGDGAGEDLWHAASLPLRLPEGSYRLDPEPGAVPATRFATGWALGAYSFTRYRKAPRPAAELVWPREADRAHVERTARASDLVRDLVNTPAEEMGPADLARAAKDMAGELKLDIDVINRDALLQRTFPLD